MPIICTAPAFPLNQVPPARRPLTENTVYRFTNVACSEKEHGRTVAVMSNTEGPSVPDFDLPIEVVVKAL